MQSISLLIFYAYFGIFVGYLLKLVLGTFHLDTKELFDRIESLQVKIGSIMIIILFIVGIFSLFI